jgi:class 3 adenylate cyclase
MKGACHECCALANNAPALATDDRALDWYTTLMQISTSPRLVELAGDDHFWFVGETDSIIDSIQEFVTGARPARDVDRVLTTLLFTDIVGSTEMVTQVGDARWTELLARHDEMARAQIEAFRGIYVDSTGDGLLARFDGPARAVRCALTIGQLVGDLGFEIRAGVHTGEVELDGKRISGITVHIAARVAALAGASEVLVSSTVKDLVAGSGLAFEGMGQHQLKGVPGRRSLYRSIDERGSR